MTDQVHPLDEVKPHALGLLAHVEPRDLRPLDVALNYHRDAFAPVALCLYCMLPLVTHTPSALRSCTEEVWGA